MSDTDNKRPSMMPEEFVSHARTAAQEARHAFEALVPKLPASFIEHQRAARHEMLQAMRSLLDAAIERTK
jgi:glutamine synthetase adenylyltransferase